MTYSRQSLYPIRCSHAMICGLKTPTTPSTAPTIKARSHWSSVIRGSL